MRPRRQNPGTQNVGSIPGVQFYSRSTKKIETEVVVGEGWIRWLYNSGPGYFLERTLLSRKPLSWVYGLFNDTRWSARRVEEFCKTYGIDLSLFERPRQGYASFNDFFSRRYKTGVRVFEGDERVFSAPVEGRFLLVSLQEGEDVELPMKGAPVSLKTVLGSEELAKKFTGGWALVGRLCPVDYHRFHFPVSGQCGSSESISGALHSVNPIALRRVPETFSVNERQRSLVGTSYFGDLLSLEVGAMCVGRMVQTYRPGRVKKGDEKGTFLFGASTVVWFVEPGRIHWDQDLLDFSAKGLETWVPLGQRIGIASETRPV